MSLHDGKFQHDLQLRIVKILNLILLTIPFAICWFIYYSKENAMPFHTIGNWLVVLLFAYCYFTYGRIYEAFLVSLKRISEIIYSQVLAALFSDCILYIVICLLSRRAVNIIQLFFVIIVQSALSTLWAVLAHKWYFRRFAPSETIIVYDMNRGVKDLIEAYGLKKKFAVKRELTIDSCLTDLSQLDTVQTVFLVGVHSKERNIVIKYCVERDIRMFIIPRIGDVVMSGASKIHMFHLPMLRVGRYEPVPEYVIAKRLFDIVMSCLVLIVTSPILLITAIAIKVYDGGPVLYKQCRLTKDGREFTMLKFRSMRVDAEEKTGAVLSAGKNDDRITPVGRIIRMVRMDELPQLINVLKGEMSIVGPRPERPEIAKAYEKELPEFKLRLQAKAGLTGYAQVYGKYNSSPYDKLLMDLMYIAEPRFSEDLKICFATVKILFMPESTEGVGSEPEGEEAFTEAAAEVERTPGKY